MEHLYFEKRLNIKMHRGDPQKIRFKTFCLVMFLILSPQRLSAKPRSQAGERTLKSIGKGPGEPVSRQGESGRWDVFSGVRLKLRKPEGKGKSLG